MYVLQIITFNLFSSFFLDFKNAQAHFLPQWLKVMFFTKSTLLRKDLLFQTLTNSQ